MTPALRVGATVGALVGLLLVSSGWAGAESVLVPGQEGKAQALFRLHTRDLGAGFAVEGLRLVHDRVEVRLTGPAGRLEATLFPPGRTEVGAIQTPAGALVLPPELPAAVRDGLVDRLREASPLIYRRLTDTHRDAVARPPPAKLDTARAAEEARIIGDRVARRLRGEAVDVPLTTLAPTVQAALDHLGRGELAEARDRLAPSMLGDERAPPMGAISAWMAADGFRVAGGCKPGVTCVIEHIRLTSSGHFSRVNPQALDRLGQEPRALVSLASQYMDRGTTEDAAAALWMALAAPLADPDAVALARAWGWTEASLLEATHLPAGAQGDRHTTTWIWPVVAALAFLLALALLAWRERTPSTGVAVSGALLGLVTLVALTPPDLHPDPKHPEASLLTLGRGGPCVLGSPWITASSWHAVGRCDGADVALSIVRRSDGETASGHHVHVKMDTGGRPLPGPIARWKAGVIGQVRALEATGWALTPEVARRPPSLREKVWSQVPLMRQGMMVAAVMAAVALPCVLFLWWQALTWLLRTVGRTREQRIVLGGLFAVAVLTHVLAPSKMVMVFGGYDQVHHLAAADALRYGPGATWIYGPWLWLSTVDHAVVQTLNRVLGVLSLVLLWSLAGRLVPDRPRVPLLLAAMTVSAPLLWRDHASESLLVGGLFFGLAGLWGLAQSERAMDWLLAIPCLLLAALTRPEFAMAFCALSLFVVWSRGRSLLSSRRLVFGLAASAVVCVAWFHVALMSAWVESLRQSSALEDVSVLELVSRVFSAHTVTVVWRYGPALLLPLVLVAFLARHARGLVWTVALVACLWSALTRIDLPEVSIPRVHAPIWVFWALLGAIGADLVTGRLLAMSRSKCLAGGALLVGLWLASAGLTLPTLYGPTNADEEEALIQDARRHLGDAPFGCLATMLSQDPPAHGKASRAFPGYLFNHADRPLVLSGLTELGRMWPRCDGPVYALLGVRCYAAMREDTGAAAPTDDTPLVACAEFRERWQLAPIIEREVVNHGDKAFPMYPATPRLPLGFYRVEGPAGP